MVPTDATAEFRLADTAVEADTLAGRPKFVQACFLSANALSVRDHPRRARTGRLRLRKVVFEDAKTSAKFASEWLRLRWDFQLGRRSGRGQA
jgi:hypothetical protein